MKTNTRDAWEDPPEILTPEDQARLAAMPDGYRKRRIEEVVAFESRLVRPRRNQTIEEIMARQKRREEHQERWLSGKKTTDS